MLHFHLQPQYKYELFHIYFTQHSKLGQHKNVALFLNGVKDYLKVLSGLHY